MQPRPTRPQEVTLPAAALGALRRALAAELEGDAAARALEASGCAAGHELFPGLIREEGATTPSMPDFAASLDRLLASRGWGRLRHDTPHPGVGELTAEAWLEADFAEGAARPSCFFTRGLLAALLSRTAGVDVAVLEVSCRSQGNERCRFLFGAPETLAEVHGRMLAGDDADAALTALV